MRIAFGVCVSVAKNEVSGRVRYWAADIVIVLANSFLDNTVQTAPST